MMFYRSFLRKYLNEQIFGLDKSCLTVKNSKNVHSFQSEMQCYHAPHTEKTENFIFMVILSGKIARMTTKRAFFYKKQNTRLITLTAKTNMKMIFFLWKNIGSTAFQWCL